MTKKKADAALVPPKQQTQLAAPQPTMSDMVLAFERIASNPDITPEKVHMFLDAQERVLDRQAKMAYTQAMAQFREKCPAIIKDQVVGYNTKKGGQVGYAHSSLAGALSQIQCLMHQCGLSHSWRTDQPEAGFLKVTCIITHRDGHSEETSLTLPYDNSGQKNAIQAVGSAQSYGQRYTLFAMLGLASADDDGRTGAPEPYEPGSKARMAQEARKARQAPQSQTEPDRQPQPESEPRPSQNEPITTNSAKQNQVEAAKRFKVVINDMAAHKGIIEQGQSLTPEQLRALCTQAQGFCGSKDYADALEFVLSAQLAGIVLDERGIRLIPA